uniref:Uncharacterized protein n=1 Tax=Kalanchoe fedtschenkoi TaxID=63787 RepID=A0A7N0TP78_KALFE
MRLSWRLAFLLPILVCLASAQDENLLYHTCSGANYTSNSIYQENLNALLSSLSSNNDIYYGFYNFSEGEVLTELIPLHYAGETSVRLHVKDVLISLQLISPKDAQPEKRQLFDMTTACSDIQTDRYLALGSNLLIICGIRTMFRIQTYSIKSLMVCYPVYESRPHQCTPDLSEVQCSNCLDRSFRDITVVFYGKQGGRVIGPSCNFRYEIDQFYEIPPPPSPAAPPPAAIAPPPPTPIIVPPAGGGSNKVPNIIIGVVSTICVVILIICIFIFLKLRKRKAKLESVDEIGADSLNLDFGAVKAATNNFSDDNKLGQGGFGSVYKGKLRDGQEIAVKRLATGSGQGDFEFKNEVVLVARLQHRNLVRLIGFCLEGQERLLIYEFMANASLDQFLFDPAKRPYLDWERRYKIIGGVARGLLYLHEDSRLRIIHRDLKASNILLDDEMHPKIADFGMARLFIVDQTQGNTSRIVGTYGYTAPEYAMHGQFSVKSDVYSFGVLLLELVSGQKNNCFRVGEITEDLISFAWDSWRDGNAADMIDPTIINGPRNEIMRCIHIGLLCVQESVAARPTMASVVLMLSSFSLSLPLPSEPAFFMHSSVEAERPLLADYSSRASISSHYKLQRKLVDGKEIGMNRLATNSGKGDLEFKNEIVIVAKPQHRNLVRLLGFCLDGIERLLIFVSVPNSSIDNFTRV